MKNILVLGAGRSSPALISCLLEEAFANDWFVTVGDVTLASAAERVGNHPRGIAVLFDIHDAGTTSVFESADIVVSLLPPHLHLPVAAKCLEYGKHLLNASYVSDEMKALHAEAVSKGLVFLNECGLDPGIDHMSAMQVIDRIRSQDGRLTSFESFTGGLISPETDPGNPWRYKFTWNPRNVVMAGQGTAKYLHHGIFKYTPYQRLFRQTTSVHVSGYGEYEGYANRDSLKYIDTYQLEGITSMLRGTLRNKGFCSAWNVFVQLGCCDDSYQMEGVRQMTHRSFLDSFLPEGEGISRLEEKIARALDISVSGGEIGRLRWSGFFSDEPVGLEKGTPARILEHILNKKWALSVRDRDQIVMWHRFIYAQGQDVHEIQSTLVATGTDATNTAMAQTVGLPLAIAAKLIYQGRIAARGVVIPTTREFYEPILAELKTRGIELNEAPGKSSYGGENKRNG